MDETITALRKNNQSKPALYLAAPLFTPAEREFNERLRKLLEPYFSVFLPQKDGLLLADLITELIPLHKATEQIFKADIAVLDKCDVILALLDGRTIDEGVCFELGYAFALKKHCFGLQTDTRQLLPSGNNPMIDESCERIFRSVDELVLWAQNSL